MFLEVRKAPQVYIQHKAMGPKYLAPITSTLRINLDLVAEVSMYTLKDNKQRMALDGRELYVPEGSTVIHLEMSYTHSTHRENIGQPSEHTVNERYFYKLVFFPDAAVEYARIRGIIDQMTIAS
ncbi:hypothetical protein EDC56_0148 [Sinobacterium caligoides]|uniref:Uncharacterized protein n=1 Tax=Sinobacterium caligoides TaxID=933926 RepID=A0A3N2DY97_9GAMM|nr:hypothetical protein [Sinobacterium caligoides]ROS04642.1 hypothetical protein EDC56_0148 [Sinobacterium caligoides]